MRVSMRALREYILYVADPRPSCVPESSRTHRRQILPICDVRGAPRFDDFLVLTNLDTSASHPSRRTTNRQPGTRKRSIGVCTTAPEQQ